MRSDIMQDKSSPEEAFIPASQSLPEITLKAVILSVLLTVILTAANAYLGLKIGQTISASIPAAVLSMGILRLFRNSNVLENNIIQTAASAGEALVAGIAFIIPALVLLHFWQNFNYWETVLIGIVGGTLGVLFSVPLRRVLLAEKTLRFPEGTAIGNVLKASASSGKNIKYLISGGLVGGIISFAQNGLEVLSGSVQYYFRFDKIVAGFSGGFDPAVIAAGYIAGMNVAIAFLVGIIVAWVFGIPFYSYIDGIPQPNNPLGSAMDIYHSHIRYVGVGMMLIGGFWTLVTFLKPMMQGIHASFISLREMRKGTAAPIPRTEKDLPINYVAWFIALLVIPVFAILWHYTAPASLPVGHTMRVSIVLIGTAYAIIAGFFFSAICAYFTGMVGSSNNPLSGMALSALILISLLMLGILSYEINFENNHTAALNASVFTIIIGGIIASAAAISNDTIQDLKAGQMVGATPWKQQTMLMIGVVIAALVIPEILNLLFNAYGLGGVFPHPGMDARQMLSAPQASLMAALVQGIFGHHLPWGLIYTGFGFGAVCIIVDTLAKRHNHRFPVLAVALGVYLPLAVTVPLIAGGILSGIVEKSRPDYDQRQRGLILASGLVAGAALMGVILAIPFVIAKSSDALKIVSDSFTPVADGLGIAVGIGLLFWMYRVIKKG
jgi:putative OPT family oligopeptide transporter